MGETKALKRSMEWWDAMVVYIYIIILGSSDLSTEGVWEIGMGFSIEDYEPATMQRRAKSEQDNAYSGVERDWLKRSMDGRCDDIFWNSKQSKQAEQNDTPIFFLFSKFNQLLVAYYLYT